MSAVLISYDLNKPGQDYDAVHKAIKELGTWWHYLESTWIVAGPGLTAQGAFDNLRSSLDAGDRLLAVDITGDAHQGWLPQAAWDWINRHVK